MSILEEDFQFKKIKTDEYCTHYSTDLNRIISIPNNSTLDPEIINFILKQANISHLNFINSYKQKRTPKFKPSIAVFFDLLGFSNKVKELAKKDDPSTEIIELEDLIENATNVLKDRTANNNLSIDNMDYFSILSDSGILIQELNQQNHESTSNQVVNIMASIQFQLATNGYLIRGALSIGGTHISKNVVFSVPLIDAVKTEANNTEYPQLVLDKEIVPYIKEINIWEPDFILKDSEDIWFINYLHMSKIFEELDSGIWDTDAIIGYLYDHKNMIIHQLKIHKKSKLESELRILKKYNWLAEYHNYYCHENYKDIEDLIISDIGHEYTFELAL